MKEISGLISIARKAGYCIIGQDNLLGYDKKLYLILLDKNAGNSLSKSIKYMAEQRGLELILLDGLAEKTNLENCKVLGIKNKGLSEEIVKRIKGE